MENYWISFFFLLASFSQFSKGASVKASLSATAPTNGLIDYWPITNQDTLSSIRDTVGTINLVGVVGGKSAQISFVPGRSGNDSAAVALNGAGTDVYLKLNSSISTLTSITLSYWVKFTNVTESNFLTLFANTGDVKFRCGSFDQVAEYVFEQLINNITREQDLISEQPSGKNKWINQVVQVSGTQLDVFENGVLFPDWPSNIRYNLGKYLRGDFLYFGARSGVKSEPGSYALLDDIRLYNRTLSKKEIQDIYNDQ